jgi:hypothetical protein
MMMRYKAWLRLYLAVVSIHPVSTGIHVRVSAGLRMFPLLRGQPIIRL